MTTNGASRLCGTADVSKPRARFPLCPKSPIGTRLGEWRDAPIVVADCVIESVPFGGVAPYGNSFYCSQHALAQSYDRLVNPNAADFVRGIAIEHECARAGTPIFFESGLVFQREYIAVRKIPCFLK